MRVETALVGLPDKRVKSVLESLLEQGGVQVSSTSSARNQSTSHTHLCRIQVSFLGSSVG